MRSLLSMLVLASCLPAQDLDPAQWEFRRKLTVKTPGVLHFVRISPEILAHSRPDLGDLRVMHEATALPYAVEALNGSVTEERLSPAVSDKVRTPAGELQFTLRLPPNTRHSRLKIDTTDNDFRRTVHIESSEDGKNWDVALERGYVMKHEQDGQQWAALEVNYPVTTRPYLRVRIVDWPDPKTLTLATLVLRKELPPLMQTVREFVPVADPSALTHETLLRADFGERPAPWSRLRVETKSTAFYRAARVEVSDDGKLWRTAGYGVLSRIGDTSELVLQGGEQRARYARLRIFNRDDQPITVDKLVFEAPTRMVKFIPHEPGEHSLWYGNPKAKSVSYDLAVVLDRDAPIERITLVPGPEHRYGDFIGSIKPWTEKHPTVLYVAVFAGAALIAAYTLRMMKKIAANQKTGS
ncbi:MAG: DUF3999 family protein [Acidobacteriota bacterium]